MTDQSNGPLVPLDQRIDALERAEKQTENALGHAAENIERHAADYHDLKDRVEQLAAESAAAFALMRTEIEELKTAVNQATEAKLELEKRLAEHAGDSTIHLEPA